jgi:hypothetical protein
VRTLGAILLCDPATGEVSRTIDMPVRGSVQGLLFAPDGRHLITASIDGTVAIVRLAEAAKTTPSVPVSGATP